MDHNRTEIEQDPPASRRPLLPLADHVVAALDAANRLIGQRCQRALAGAGADDEVVRETSRRRKVQQENVLPLLLRQQVNQRVRQLKIVDGAPPAMRCSSGSLRPPPRVRPRRPRRQTAPGERASARRPDSTASQVPSPTTGLPALSARAISDRVPSPPPMAITACAPAATSQLRPLPMPVGNRTDNQGLPDSIILPGRIPTVVPPAS